MNNKNSHNDKNWELTPEMILAYHAGTLSAEKMHWVESQLLDDEFAADAFEGVTDVQNLPDILAALEQKIDERIEQEDKKIIPFRFKAWQIAASLSLLIVASYFIFNSLNPSKQTLALEENLTQPPTESLQKNKPSATENLEIADKQTFEKSEPQERKEQAKAKEVLSNFNTTPSTKPIIEPIEIVSIDMDDMIAEEAEMEEVMIEQEAADVEYKKEDDKQFSEVLSGKAAGVEVSKEKTANKTVRKRVLARKEKAGDIALKDAKNKTITGKIIDSEGTALPGVNVIIKGTSTGVVTDFDGNFSISSFTENNLLTISFIGYNSKDIKVTNLDILNIVLDEDVSALSEVVVVGYGTSKNSELNTYQSASPNSGTSAYKKYLQKNIRYPKAALDRKIEGKVKIIFYVEPNGSLTNFEVKKSLGYGCDEEAIRLIKEGPKWSAAERDGSTFRQKASVTIRFKLER